MFLVVINDERGALVGERLLEEKLSVGRNPDNDFVLPSSSVSRYHARLFLHQGRPYIQDLGSSNGVYVNDLLAQDAIPIDDSSQIRVGTYRVYLEPYEEVNSERSGFQTAVVRPSKAHGKLVVIGGEFAGKEFLLIDPIYRVGRTEENEITLPHSSISRHHAQLKRQDDGSYILSDAKSSNGTRARGRRINRGLRVFHGDHISFGQVECILVDPQGKKRQSVDTLQIIAWMIIFAAIISLGLYFGPMLRG